MTADFDLLTPRPYAFFRHQPACATVIHGTLRECSGLHMRARYER